MFCFSSIKDFCFEQFIEVDSAKLNPNHCRSRALKKPFSRWAEEMPSSHHVVVLVRMESRSPFWDSLFSSYSQLDGRRKLCKHMKISCMTASPGMVGKSTTFEPLYGKYKKMPWSWRKELRLHLADSNQIWVVFVSSKEIRFLGLNYWVVADSENAIVAKHLYPHGPTQCPVETCYRALGEVI